VYRAEPAIESLLKLRPEQTARLTQALKETLQAPRFAELETKSKEADLAQKKQAKSR